MADFKEQQPVHTVPPGSTPWGEASPCPSCRWQDNSARSAPAYWCLVQRKRFGKAGWSTALALSPSYRLVSCSHWDFLSSAHVRKWEWAGQGCQQGTEGIKLAPMGKNLKSQEATLTSEITSKSLQLSLLCIFHHPPDASLLLWNSCSKEEDSIFTAVLLELGIRDEHYQCRP